MSFLKYPYHPTPHLHCSPTIYYSEGAGTSTRTAKRASNILQLAAENNKLNNQLRELSERLERIEKRTHALNSHKDLPIETQPPRIPPKDQFPTIPTSRMSVDSTRSISSASRTSKEYAPTPRPSHGRQGSQSSQLGLSSSPYRTNKV